MEINTNIEGNRADLEIVGELDSWASERLRDSIMEAVRNGSSEVAIDFASVTHIGSSALSLILEFQKDLESLGGRLVLKNMGKKIKSILHALKIDLSHLIE